MPVARVRHLLSILLILCGPATAADLLVRVWQSQDGLPSNVVRSVAQSEDGYLWVATAEGVARFDGFEFETLGTSGAIRGRRLAYRDLFTTAGGGVWATTFQGGLLQLHQGSLREVLEALPTPASAVVSQVVSLRGRTYYKRGDEIGEINAAGVASSIRPDAELAGRFAEDLEWRRSHGRPAAGGEVAHLKDSRGREWLAGASGGLTMTDGEGRPLKVELPDGGAAYSVEEMMEDREGNIWFASPVNGLVRVRSLRVNLLDPQAGHERAVVALREDRAGVWWIASRRGGMIRWTRDSATYLPLSHTRSPRPAAAIFEDRSDRLWVASREGSVFRFENGDFQPQFARSQVPSKVRSITQDGDGLMWFAGAQGLASFDGETVHDYGADEGVGEADLTVVQPFPGGGVIAGSSDGRILVGDKDGFARLGEAEDLDRHWISGILPLSRNEIWVSTLGSGLYLWNGSRWTGFGLNDGLPDARLTCVLEDGYGYLWFGSLGGIIRAERKSLLARVLKPESRVEWLRLDHTDGLPSRECIGGFQPAGWRAASGELWFPTGGGVARVAPRLIEQNRTPPPVYLQSVRANGVRQPAGADTIVTEPGRARLEFRYVGLAYSAPEKTTYRARLAGLDDTWRELGGQRIAAYEAVPPGDYVFEVMAVNGDGLRSASPARIRVVVEPHFWETRWFSLSVGVLVLLMAAGGGWLAARVRMKRRIQLLKIRHAREGERSRIARDLHDDLGASLTEISILAALAAEEAEEGPLRPSLDHLSIKAKHVVGSLDEIVWAVNPREDTLRSLVDYIAAFAREFLDLARIPLRTDVGRDIPDLAISAPRRHAVFLATREALNNIVKHAGATEVHLAIRATDELLEIRIQDNGCGFEPDYVNGGNGIGNLNARMHDVGGSCEVETYRRQGTTVTLRLPLPHASGTHPN